MNYKIKNNIKNADEFITYFSHTFLNFKNDSFDENKVPLFHYTFWSACRRIENNMPRTTNSVEAWHRGLNNYMKCAHPNIAKVIDFFQKEDEKVRIKIVQAMSGSFALSNKDLNKEEKIRIIVENYNNFDGLGFFEALEGSYIWLFDEN